MTAIIVAIILGIIVGCLDIIKLKGKIILDKVSKVCLFIMIFCLAAKVGCDKELVASLERLGTQSLALTVGVIGGSFLVVWITSYFFRNELNALIKEEAKK